MTSGGIGAGRVVVLLTLVLATAACEERARGSDAGSPSADASDLPPLFADILYHVQCRCHGGCTGATPRDINNVHGEDGHEISCTAVERGSGGRAVSFSAFKGTEYGIALDFELPVGGGSPSGAGCTARILDNGTTYEGACGPTQPSASQPCRVYDVEVGMDEDGNPQIAGSMVCIDLPAATDPGVLREVTAPNSPVDTSDGACGVLAETEPVRFRLVNCRGL